MGRAETPLAGEGWFMIVGTQGPWTMAGTMSGTLSPRRLLRSRTAGAEAYTGRSADSTPQTAPLISAAVAPSLGLAAPDPEAPVPEARS